MGYAAEQALGTPIAPPTVCHFVLAPCAIASVLLLSAPASARADELTWDAAWQRVEWPHYVATGATLGLMVVGLVIGQNEDAFSDGILFDDAMRDAFTLGSKSQRRQAVIAGDVFYWGLWAYPPLVDIGVAALAVHRSPDVAWQMFWIDAQAYALAGMVSRFTQKLVGRHRSFVASCADDPDYDDECDEPADRSQGTVSGHTAMAFTGAGLMCLHHSHLDLYGGGAPDILACSLSLAAATYVGWSRIVGDRHWTTDVLGGAAVGLFSGWLLPELLHYRFEFGAPDLGVEAVLLPAVSDTTTGLNVAARW